MRHILIYIAIVTFACVSCSKENINRQDETVSIRFNITGEIEERYYPLTKSINNDLLGIIVEKNKGGNYKPYEFFAGGLFDNISDLTVNLKKDAKYRIRCIYIKDGKTTVNKDDSYHIPEYDKPYSKYGIQINNAFDYNNSFDFDTGWYSEYSKCQDTYYFEVDNYIPSPQAALNIDLKHTVLGLKYTIIGLTDGYLTMLVKTQKENIFSSDDISENGEANIGIIRCINIENAFQYPDNYTETATVSIKWMRGIGIEEDLGSTDITLKRNMLNNIKINLSANDRDSNFGINTETTDMGNESTYIEIK